MLSGGKQTHVPRHPLAGHRRQRAGPAVDRVPARLRELGPASTSTSPTGPRTSASSSSSARARPAPTRAPSALVLRMDDPEANHNGGLLLFGPDKHMYIGTGDGGGARRPARRARQRAEPRLAARQDPAHRPEASRAARPTRSPPTTRSWAAPARGREIYSYGLRNPWRFSFDRKTGDLDDRRRRAGRGRGDRLRPPRQGQAARTSAGGSFEGRSRYTPGESAPGAIKPVITRSHSDGWCSITGGVVVRDPALTGLRGRYLFGDFCKRRIQSAKLSAGKASSRAQHVAEGRAACPRSGRTRAGASTPSRSSGPVYRLVPR